MCRQMSRGCERESGAERTRPRVKRLRPGAGETAGDGISDRATSRLTSCIVDRRAAGMTRSYPRQYPAADEQDTRPWLGTHFNSIIFRLSWKSGASIVQKYTPLPTEPPLSFRPSQTATWRPGSVTLSTSVRTSRPLTS